MPAITEIIVFVTEDEGESLMSVRANRTWLPLVDVDSESVIRMVAMAEKDGRPYRILRFRDREDITEKQPKRSHKSGTISAVSVILATDEDGDEEIVTSPDYHLPMAAVFPRGLRAMVEMARSAGQPFRVIRFSGREDVTERFAAKKVAADK
jgi:Lon protease-like protein